jgi:IPT/TIG domain
MTGTSRLRPILLVIVALVAIAMNIACERRGGQSTLTNPLSPSPVTTTQATAPVPGTVGTEGTTIGATTLSLPILKFPKPVVSRIDPTSAAPGATITLYGTDLNPPGSFLTPIVRFGYSWQYVQAVSNTQLRVTVPSGSGTVSLHLETVGGNSSNFTFTYKAPMISSMSPTTGGKGQTITIAGQGFGVKQPFDAGSFVKFGDSVTGASQWTDQMIVVKAPSDFGTGLNTDLLFALIGCAAEAGGPTGAAKLILQLSVPGCKDLFADIVRKYQLSTNPGFLQKQVQVVVRTNAGTSNARTFTYKVTMETR